ncbi:MAG: CPXCG motif-containing cysteine-rich protein [Nitrococcus sp.]|nr:CPXCG motif-containing cysteine-rich protein [Nitrococcus sp.]
MLEEADIACPYCGETITLLVDCTAGDQRYIEDCCVCCQPIVISVRTTADGRIADLQAQSDDD